MKHMNVEDSYESLEHFSHYGIIKEDESWVNFKKKEIYINDRPSTKKAERKKGSMQTNNALMSTLNKIIVRIYRTVSILGIWFYSVKQWWYSISR